MAMDQETQARLGAAAKPGSGVVWRLRGDIRAVLAALQAAEARAEAAEREMERLKKLTSGHPLLNMANSLREANDLATQQYQRAEAAESALAEARAAQITGFYEDGPPHYTQGAPTHEIQSLMTADEANGMVQKVVALTSEVARLRAELEVTWGDRALNENDRLRKENAALTVERDRLREDVQNDYKALWEQDSAKVERLERALRLHQPGTPEAGVTPCIECRQEWPCGTARAALADKEGSRG